MKKINKKLKTVVIVSLIVIVVSSFSLPVLADSNLISEGISKLTENVLHPNEHSKEVKRKEETPPTLTQEITTPPQVENPIDAIKAKAAENRKHRLHQQDEYNYVQKDVETLLLSGATLEDIYRSDEIGNQWLVNPRDLVDRKRNGNKSWDDIETNVAQQKKKQLEELRKKHTDIESKFASQTISDAEKLEILKHIESNNEQIDEVIAAYQAEGRSGLQKLQDKNGNGKGGK